MKFAVYQSACLVLIMVVPLLMRSVSAIALPPYQLNGGTLTAASTTRRRGRRWSHVSFHSRKGPAILGESNECCKPLLPPHYHNTVMIRTAPHQHVSSGLSAAIAAVESNLHTLQTLEHFCAVRLRSAYARSSTMPLLPQ